MFGRPRGERYGEEGVAVAVLRVLEEQMGTALEVTQRLEERFGGRLDIGAGEIYPILQYLEDRGFVAQEPVGERKVYAVTEAGFAHLAEQSRRPNEPREDRDFFRQERRHGWGWHKRHHWHHHFNHDFHREMHGLFHDAVHLVKLCKHGLRHGSVDREQIARIRQILDRARREVEDALRDRGHGLA